MHPVTAAAASAVRSASVAALGIDTGKIRAERRVSHRAACSVVVRDRSNRAENTLYGETLNVSRRGLAIQLASPLPTGTAVEIMMHAPDGTPRCLLGQVLHSRRVLSGTYEIGVLLVCELRPEAA